MTKECNWQTEINIPSILISAENNPDSYHLLALAVELCTMFTESKHLIYLYEYHVKNAETSECTELQ